MGNSIRPRTVPVSGIGDQHRRLRWGYTRFDLPTTAGLRVSRTDFVPDGQRGALFGLTITNPGAARTAKLTTTAGG